MALLSALGNNHDDDNNDNDDGDDNDDDGDDLTSGVIHSIFVHTYGWGKTKSGLTRSIEAAAASSSTSTSSLSA